MVHLHTISSYLFHSSLPILDKYLLLASCLVAFFGLLRVSEYTCPTQTEYDKALHLLTTDIQFNSDFTIMSVRIKASKTDPFRIGTTIRISATFYNLCPVGAIDTTNLVSYFNFQIVNF